MSIAKMQKISLVAQPHLKDDLIYALQSSQTVDVNDLSVKLEKSDITFTNNEKRNEENFDDLYERSEIALTILSQYGQKVSLKDRLLAKRERLTMDELHEKINVEETESLIKQIESLNLRREDITESRNSVMNTLDEKGDMLRRWENLDTDPDELAKLEKFVVRVGTLSRVGYNKFTSQAKEQDFTINEVFSNSSETGFTVTTGTEQERALDSLLADNDFKALDYDFGGAPGEVLYSLENQRKELNEEEEQVVSELQDLQKEKTSYLKLAAEELYNRSQRETVAHLSFDNKQLVLLSGWVEKEDVAQLKDDLSQSFDSDSYALVLEEMQEEEIDENEVPIKLKNNSLVEPFESIIVMYGAPNYKELDPTAYVAFFYMIFFAMMLGDLGYALILWGITLFALKAMDLRRGLRNTIKMFHLVSYPSMIIGLIYGSFFGTTIPTQIINPTEDAMTLLFISMGVGYIHLFTALCLNAYLRIKEGNYADAFTDGIGWLMMFVGLALGIVGYLTEISFLVTAAIAIAAVGLLGVILVPVFTHKNKGVGLALGLYGAYDITSYLGDFVSYSRLMALGISGGSIAFAFNIIFGILPVPIRFTVGILLIVALHAFNLFLSLLSAYVHGLRLTFVEFFGKFYTGGGKVFKTIPTLQKYIKLEDVEEVK